MVAAKRRRGAITVLAAAMLLVCADARAADGDFYIDGCLGRVEVPRAGADAPGQAADEVRDAEPDGAAGPAQPVQDRGARPGAAAGGGPTRPGRASAV